MTLRDSTPDPVHQMADDAGGAGGGEERLGSLYTSSKSTATGRRRRFTPNVRPRATAQAHQISGGTSTTSAHAGDTSNCDEIQGFKRWQNQTPTASAIEQLQQNAARDAESKRSREQRRQKKTETPNKTTPAVTENQTANTTAAKSSDATAAGGAGSKASDRKKDEKHSGGKKGASATDLKPEFDSDVGNALLGEVKQYGESGSWIDTSQYYPTLLPTTPAHEVHTWVSIGFSPDALLHTDDAHLVSDGSTHASTYSTAGVANQADVEGVHGNTSTASKAAADPCDTKSLESDANFTLLQLPDPWPLPGGSHNAEGYVGRLRLHKDGSVSLKLGETVFEVDKGTPIGHAEQLGRLEVAQPPSNEKASRKEKTAVSNDDTAENATGGELALLGNVRSRMVGMLDCG